MRSPNPAAEFAELLFVRCRNPFHDGKLFPGIASVTLPPGDKWQCEAIVRGREIKFRLEANELRSSPC